MKKILFIVMFFLSLIILEQNTKAYDCPDPSYTYRVVVMDIGGCPVTVHFCYKCSPLGLTETWIEVQRIDIPKNCRIDSIMTFEEVMAQVRMNFFAFGGYYVSSLCWPQGIIPCGNLPYNYYTVTIKTPRCMKKYNDNGNIWYFICPNAPTCSVTYKICWDPVLGIRILETGNGIPSPGDSTCMNVEMQPDPEKEHYSSCFKVGSPCDE